MWSSDARSKLVISNPKEENMAVNIHHAGQRNRGIKYKGNIFNDRLIAS
jgi:hypothetical protein